ncbi:unnamed protein product [Prorocentrum cordatum]|uniref:Anoctamin transmembrane domain-containing protein n=1 Tax=Prorocentrum cordatum TaxID=2364126 RepID=A0ABN9PMI3_9DINO|nr:unnamed protein product [Polarella glacialis]
MPCQAPRVASRPSAVLAGPRGHFGSARPPMAADVARLRLAVSLESLDGADLSSDGGGSDGFSSSCSSSSRGDEWVTTPGGNRHLGTSPLLGRDVVIDEEEATYVLVFTRASPGAVKNCDAMVTEPLARAREIFLQPRDQIIEGLGIENMGAAEYIKEMSVGEYHEIVRHKIEAILRRSGFVCSCFSSVDGDETFLKIHLDPDGDTVRKLAEQFKYQVPLSKSNYDSRKRITTDDAYCFAYTPFTVDLHSQGKLQRLRRVDVIRIAHRHLSNLINLQELVHQKFITAHFPVEGFKEQRELKEKWALPLGSGPLPSQVRSADFGEKIAFFFHFFAFYVRAVCLLSVIALCFCWMDFSEVRVVDVWTKSYVRFLLAAVIVIWAIVFEISLNRSCARMAHVWGMSATTMKFVESDLPEFDKKLVGTPTAKYRGYIAHVCTILYCALFIIGVCAMKKPRVLGYFDPYKHWIITFLIVLAKWQWGKSAAPKLTRMENHKTQQRFDDALTLRLAAFKLFFTLWPPMSIFDVSIDADDGVLRPRLQGGSGARVRRPVAGGPRPQHGHAVAQWGERRRARRLERHYVRGFAGPVQVDSVRDGLPLHVHNHGLAWCRRGLCSVLPSCVEL